MTRGVTNANPGNIRKSATKWAGMADEQLDPDFVTFKSPEYGIRAMCRILLTYGERDKNTTAEIISTWAPEGENNTGAYIDDVAKRCGWDKDTKLDVDQADVMRPLVKAIIWHENGQMPYKDEVIDNGMRLAGISDMTPAPAMASKTTQGATIASVSTAIAAAGEGLRQLQDARDTIDQATDLLHWALHFGPMIALVFVAAGLGLMIVDHFRKRKSLGV